MGLSYLGTGLLNGAAPAAGGYGGYGAYGALPPNPNPGPYGFGPGIPAGYGHPGAAPAPYLGLTPTNYGAYQPYPNYSGGYGTWSPSEYGIPR